MENLLFKIIKKERKIVTERDNDDVHFHQTEKVKETFKGYVEPFSGLADKKVILRALISVEKEYCNENVSYEFEKYPGEDIIIENFNRSINGNEPVRVGTIIDFIREYANELYEDSNVPKEIKEDLLKISVVDVNMLVHSNNILSYLKENKMNKR